MSPRTLRAFKIRRMTLKFILNVTGSWTLHTFVQVARRQRHRTGCGPAASLLKTLKVSEDEWTVRNWSPAWLSLPSVNQQMWWIETLMNILGVRFWLWSGQTLTGCTHTQQLLVSFPNTIFTQTHTCTQSYRAAISHSVRSDSPQWLVTNTGQPVHLPATAHHHTH